MVAFLSVDRPGRTEPISLIIGGVSAGGIAVKSFFFISGILIASSAMNASWQHFLFSRFLRVWPALLFALALGVALSAVVSVAPGHEFSIGVIHYFKNNLTLFAGVQYGLPGAFLTNPNQSVNGSLWTLPWEVRMYAVVFVASLLGILKKKDVANLFLLMILFFCLSGGVNFLGFVYDNPDAPLMVLSFTLGMFVAVNFSSERYPASVFRCSPQAPLCASWALRKQAAFC